MSDPVYTVYVRDAVFQVVGAIVDYKTITLVRKFNAVGTWSLEIDSNSLSVPLLLAGGGIIVKRNINGTVETIFSGSSVQEITRTVRTVTISGLSDEVYLEEPARPTPSLATSPYPNDYDVRTGIPSTVMRLLVDANIGSSAPAGPRVPNLFITQADPLLGSTLTSRARLQPLLELLRELAATEQAGGLGFTVLQHETNAGNLDFRIWAPQDRTATARFSVVTNTAQDYSDVLQYSNVNYWVVLGGDGFGAQRSIVEGGNTDAIAAAGRRIVGVFDARGTVNTGELNQKLAELLAGAVSIRKTTVTPFESDSLVFGVHWNFGDLVSVIVNGVAITQVIREVQIVLDAAGVRITPTIADPNATNDDTLAQHVQSLQDRMSNVERNWFVPDASILEAMMTSGSISARTIQDHVVHAVHLHANDTPNNNEVATFDAATGNLKWLSFAELAGTGSINNLTVVHNTILGTTGADTLAVNAQAAFNAALTVNAGATFKQNVTIENSVLTSLADFVVTAGAQTVRLGDVTVPGLYVDVPNLRTIVGGTTALPSAANDKFTVLGGTSYFAGNSGPSIGIRYNASQTVGWLVGVSAAGANADLVFYDDGGLETFRVGDTASGYQASVTGNIQVSGQGILTGALSAGRAVLNGTTFSGSEKLRVTSGTSRLEGAVTVTTGGINVTGASAFVNAVSLATAGGGVDIHGGLDVVTGGITIDASDLAISAGNIDLQGGTGGQFRGGTVLVNRTNPSGAEKLRVNGISLLENLVQLAGTGTVFSLIGSSQTQSGVGAAGAASALPATPRWYLKVDVGGSSGVIPIYNA